MKAYKHNGLVYIPIYKNAATSHEYFFGQTLRWQVILTENIDWANDTVFSHISDPYERHLRGTAQFLFHNKLQSIVDDQRFEKLLISGYFDHHCYPLTVMFGDKMDKITWLLLDRQDLPSNVLTSDFLIKHGVNVTPEQIPHSNRSCDQRKDLFVRIKNICEKHNYQQSGLFFMLDDDMIVYNKVLHNELYRRTV